MARNFALSAYVTSFALLIGCPVCCEAVAGAVSAGGQHHGAGGATSAAAVGAIAATSEGARHHALVGELEKVDTAAKKITIRTADGTEHAVSYGGRTIVHGLTGTTKAADLAGKEGSQVVVHYTGAGKHEAADHIDVFGHDALKTTEGTLTRVDKAGHKVVVKSAEGVDETYDLGRDSAIDTKHGLVSVAHFTGKEGDHVIVYHTEEGGRKVVHLLRHI
jgi:Cu/Ag efflux protein CusF